MLNFARNHRPLLLLVLLLLLLGYSPALPVVRAGDQLQYSVSWIGNSYSGKENWVQQDVGGMCVEADGTVFTNVYWEENGGNVQQYDTTGQLVGTALHTHGWGYEGGDAVASNSNSVFIVQRVDCEGGGLVGSAWPPKGSVWSGISRRKREDMTQGAPFKGGVGRTDKGEVLVGSFLPVLTMPEVNRTGDIRGLLATNTRLYVSCAYDNSIKVYDPDTMQPLASWPVARPDRICGDRAGHIWVLQRPDKPDVSAWRALCYDEKGAELPNAFSFPMGVVPGAICIDNKDRMLVADQGVDQQVKIYGSLNTAPAPVGTLGIRGGIFAPPEPGRFGDLRFNHLTGIGSDANGNIYVASSGWLNSSGTVLECYDGTEKLVWRRLGLTFVDCAAVDPGNETAIYTKDKVFTLDYDKSPEAGGSPGGDESSSNWTYAAFTANPWKFPDDPRFHSLATDVWVRRIAGQKFLFAADMHGEMLRIFRFDTKKDGHVAIPSSIVAGKHVTGSYPAGQPGAGEWIWNDNNGNGFVDSDEYRADPTGRPAGTSVPDDAGDVWNLTSEGIRRLSIRVDSRGIPTYDFAGATTWPLPPDLDKINRIHYVNATDTLFLAGNKGDDHNQHWKPMGPVLCAYSNWTKSGGTLHWKIVLPYEAGAQWHFSHEPISFDVAGDFIFVAYTRGLAAENLTEAFIKIYRATDGSFVGNLTCDKELGQTGLLDLRESVRAFKRTNGEYVVLLEEDAKAKLILFRWRP